MLRMDLTAAVPRPQLAYTIPLLPTHVTAMKVSDNFSRILAYSPSVSQLLSVTHSHSHVLTEQTLNSFSFAGTDAAVAFLQTSNIFRIYNLTHNDLVRDCRLNHVPSLVSFEHHDAFWTVEASKKVRRLATVSDQRGPKTRQTHASTETSSNAGVL